MTRNPDMATFAKYCRYNSGSHFLDSGSAYGRHWQKPGIALDAPDAVIDIWRNEVSGAIETAHFLASAFGIDKRVMRNFQRWTRKQGDTESWFELADRYATLRT